MDEAMKKMEQLSDEDLNGIDGGSWSSFVDKMNSVSQWLTCDWDYRSGDAPKYSVGQTVHFRTGRNIEEGVITAVGGKTGGINDTEFVYTIKLPGDWSNNCYIFNGVYESNIKP